MSNDKTKPPAAAAPSTVTGFLSNQPLQSTALLTRCSISCKSRSRFPRLASILSCLSLEPRDVILQSLDSLVWPQAGLSQLLSSCCEQDCRNDAHRHTNEN